MDFTVQAHPAAIVNNVMDSTTYGKVTDCKVNGDTVTVSQDVRLDTGGLLRFLLNPLRTGRQDACYEYPYLWVAVGSVYKLWNFMLPIDSRTTRLFMISCAEQVKIPFTPFRAPTALLRPALIWNDLSKGSCGCGAARADIAPARPRSRRL